MDGIPAASLPAPMAPPAGMPPMPPGSFVPPPAQQAPAQQVPKPVGRPNSDPEQQQQREERSVVRRRMAAALPREMQEPRIAIFKLMGSRGMTKANGNRPVFTILLSDLEKAGQEGTDPGEYIKLKLEEKFPATEGRFLWEAQDHKGQKMNDYGSHEIILGEPEDEEELDEIEREEEMERQLRTTGRYGDPNRIMPPPGPAPDNATHIRAVRNIIEDQHRRSDSSASTMLQLMMTQAEDRRREDAARMEREERRREQDEARRREADAKAEERAREERREREKEQDRREEREREQRRLDREQQMQFMKIIMDSANRAPVEDKTTPLLFKMLDSKSERDGTKELFSMFNEASKQSMLMQGEASKHMMAAQAESAKMLISNILGISKQMVEAQLENSNAGPDEDPMDKIGRMFKLFGPAIQAIGQGAGTQQRLVQTQQQIPAQAPVVAQPAQQQRGQPNRKNSPQLPDNEWIKGSLLTIMRLGNGNIAPEKRFEALKWCAENLPEKMLAPIRAGDEQQVLAIGQEGADETFIGWLMADEANGEFLRGCIADIQRMLAGAFTEDSARASMQAHMAHLQRHQGQPFPQQAPAAPAPVKPAEAAAPAEPKGPRRAPAPQVAEAVPETKTAPTQPQVQNGAPGNI